jgi:starch-binding outer membrane protein, SusD/RagB family
MRFLKIYYNLIVIISLVSSCKKFVEVDSPRTQLVDKTVFANDATATSALTGIYSRMISSSGFISGGASSITILTGLSSDELTNYQNYDNLIQFYNISLFATNETLTSSLWNEPYQYIYSANAVIEGLSNSSSVNASVKQQLIGEAKFIRAFCHFYLVNLFGDIPYITTTDYHANNMALRIPRFEIYQRIINDLIEAQGLLANDYSFSGGQKIRPNKSVATAFLARVYLYSGDWTNAEAQATDVIDNSSVYSLASNLNDVFLKNSTEAIWQLMPVIPGFNTLEGFNLILTSSPSLVALSDQIVNAFELGDYRKVNWIKSITVGVDTYYYSFKYKISTNSDLSEYYMIFRLAEQYLIRAEARAQQNDIGGAQADLNVIRARSGLHNTTASTQSSLLAAILHERQVELFTEMGHRWLDLKRTNNADAVLGLIKVPDWQPTDVLYPIPLSEIQNNSNVTQNAGY